MVLINLVNTGGSVPRPGRPEAAVEDSAYFTQKEVGVGGILRTASGGNANQKILRRSLNQKAWSALKETLVSQPLHPPCKWVMLRAVLTIQDGNCDESMIQLQFRGSPDGDSDSLGDFKWLLSLVSTVNNC